jgi:hypothetical protein
MDMISNLLRDEHKMIFLAAHTTAFNHEAHEGHEGESRASFGFILNKRK